MNVLTVSLPQSADDKGLFELGALQEIGVAAMHRENCKSLIGIYRH